MKLSGNGKSVTISDFHCVLSKGEIAVDVPHNGHRGQRRALLVRRRGLRDQHVQGAQEAGGVRAEGEGSGGVGVGQEEAPESGGRGRSTAAGTDTDKGKDGINLYVIQGRPRVAR